MNMMTRFYNDSVWTFRYIYVLDHNLFLLKHIFLNIFDLKENNRMLFKAMYCDKIQSRQTWKYCRDTTGGICVNYKLFIITLLYRLFTRIAKHFKCFSYHSAQVKLLFATFDLTMWLPNSVQMLTFSSGPYIILNMHSHRIMSLTEETLLLHHSVF